MTAARTIEVQSAVAIGGPETRSHTTTADSAKRLPSAIDVERFAEARAFEIDAMQNSMKNTSCSSTHRAWQVLPRHLRRRAASHDVRRVPLRLRDKARQEMDLVKRKNNGSSIPRRGKAKRLSRTESLLKRQGDKTWLETHIWHAKRMKVENMWGYSLAVHTAEKSFRPSHRASVHGSILHDASYYSLIELRGSENILRTLLETCCDHQGPSPGAKRYTTGARVMETCIYKPGSYPFDLIAPIMIIWKPECASPSPRSDAKSRESVNVSVESRGEDVDPDHEKEKEPESDPATFRTIWIRSHPVVFQDVIDALRTTASLTLNSIRKSAGEEAKEAEIELTDLRGQVNVFEIMGPKSSQVIKGSVTPVSEDKREEFRKFWTSLTDLQTTGSLPRGIIIGLKVYDPRLKFPPKNSKPKVEQTARLSVAQTLPSPTLAYSEIWDKSTRSRLEVPRYRKKDLDERRSKHLVPGTTLHPLRKDDRVPILLIQRSLGNSLTPSDNITLHGWTLIVPAGWSMAFFSSLIFTGMRVGGQLERQTQSFEAGSLYFPRDYPSTVAYNLYAEARENEEKTRWGRKPPAKRPNFDKLGTRSPWKADWETVLGIESDGEAAGEDGVDFVSTDRVTAPVVAKDAQIRPWLLRGSEVSAILARASKMFNHAAGLWSEINKLRGKRGQDPLSATIRAEALWNSALVTVKLTMCGRGAPGDLAPIYAFDDDEAKKWCKILERRKKLGNPLDEDGPDETELSAICPSQHSIIGYVTTGNFSLSRGEGFTLGAIPVGRLFEIREQSQRLHAGVEVLNFNSRTVPLLVKVRQRDGSTCRAAYLELGDG